MPAFIDYLRRERNIGGDHEVSSFNAFDDFVVGDIEAGGHLKRPDVARWRRADRLICDQSQWYASALRCPKQDLLDHDRAGIGVYPDIHRSADIVAVSNAHEFIEL